jgi:hypothetical protein
MDNAEALDKTGVLDDPKKTEALDDPENIGALDTADEAEIIDDSKETEALDDAEDTEAELLNVGVYVSIIDEDTADEDVRGVGVDTIMVDEVVVGRSTDLIRGISLITIDSKDLGYLLGSNTGRPKWMLYLICLVLCGFQSMGL